MQLRCDVFICRHSLIWSLIQKAPGPLSPAQVTFADHLAPVFRSASCVNCQAAAAENFAVATNHSRHPRGMATSYARLGNEWHALRLLSKHYL